METKEEIEKYLAGIKNIINKSGKVIISTRDKNIDFLENYNLNTEKVKKILFNLKINDFCKVLDNNHLDRSDEKLYVFSKNMNLPNTFGRVNNVRLYIKINLKRNIIILVSFHDAKYEIKNRDWEE